MNYLATLIEISKIYGNSTFCGRNEEHNVHTGA